MRILYVTNGFPYPLTSGYLRHYYFIRELSARHAITLLSIVGAKFRPEHTAGLAPFTERIYTFAASGQTGAAGRFIKRARALAGRPAAVLRMCEQVERLTREERFDVALVSGKQTTPVLKRLEGVPLVVDMCDAASVRILGSMRFAPPLRLPLLLLGYVKMRRVERRMIRQADHLLFASCRDCEALVGRPGGRATVVPNGVDLDFWKRYSRERGADTIVFTGAMDYPPNVDAALYLIEEILPRVRAQVPSAEALIVGRDPAPALVRAGQRPGVTVTGFVEDVRPYLESATVFAAPLRFGAGIQNKLLEAMAMEVPVVASPLAADGVRTETGEAPPVRVARDREEFARLLAEELLARAGDPSPDTAARRFVERNFFWERCGEKQEEAIRAVARARQEAPSAALNL